LAKPFGLIFTTRKKFITVGAKKAIAGAPAHAGGNTQAVTRYHRRTSQVADDNIFPN
jgi:hypothetical protein